MFKESLKNKRFGAALIAVTGALALAGCSGETHGTAGIRLVDCQEGVKTNELVLDTFPKGESFDLGETIKTGDGGLNKFSIQGPLKIESLGGGLFTYSTNHGDSYAADIAPPSLRPDDTYNVQLKDAEQTYDLTGKPNPDGSTHLVIEASCQK